MEATTMNRNWWQFGIRDVLWIIVVAFVSSGWWLHEREQLQSRARSFDMERQRFYVDKSRLERQVLAMAALYETRDRPPGILDELSEPNAMIDQALELLDRLPDPSSK